MTVPTATANVDQTGSAATSEWQPAAPAGDSRDEWFGIQLGVVTMHALTQGLLVALTERSGERMTSVTVGRRRCPAGLGPPPGDGVAQRTDLGHPVGFAAGDGLVEQQCRLGRVVGQVDVPDRFLGEPAVNRDSGQVSRPATPVVASAHVSVTGGYFQNEHQSASVRPAKVLRRLSDRQY